VNSIFRYTEYKLWFSIIFHNELDSYLMTSDCRDTVVISDYVTALTEIHNAKQRQKPERRGFELSNGNEYHT
ncbi:hypothetical protein L9F63_009624, partial [Diploptera punctata]